MRVACYDSGMIVSRPDTRRGFILKRDDLLALQTDAGGYTAATLNALGVRRDVPWKIKYQLIGRYVSWNQYQSAMEGASLPSERKQGQKAARVERQDAQLMLF